METQRKVSAAKSKLWVTAPKFDSPYSLGSQTKVCDKWLCKRDGLRLTEIAAYQLADLLGVPTPEHRFFRYEHGDSSLSFCDDVGILSRLREIKRVTSYEDEIARNRDTGFKFLLLNLLSTSEFPELYIDSQETSFAIDLQFVLPDLDRNTLDNQNAIQQQVDCYIEASERYLWKCLDVIGELVPVSEFDDFLKYVQMNIVPQFEPRFNGLTSEETISKFFGRALRGRMTSVLNAVNEI
jgi:hypothetical protein